MSEFCFSLNPFLYWKSPWREEKSSQIWAFFHGHVAKLADALALGASGATRGGSTPPVPTRVIKSKYVVLIIKGTFVEVKIQELSEVERELEITATADELQPHFDKAYLEYRKKIEIRGFRKGRAPIDLVKKLYGDLIEQDALESIASVFYKQTVKEKDLKPIGEPTLVDMNYERGKEFRFKIRYDIRPQIKLQNYKGIEIEKPIHKVTDDEVESEILYIRRSKATTTPVDQVTDEECIVTVDAQEVNELNQPIIGKKDENVRLYLADEKLEQPFKEALKNATVGGVYRVQFEHKHGDHTHQVNEQLTVKKIEKVTLPELTDTFVEEVSNGKLHTVDELRNDIWKRLEEYWQEHSDRELKNALVNELIKLHEFQVPESVIRSFLENLVEDLKNSYPDKKLPDNFDYDTYYQQNRPYAIAQAKWALLREELLKAENIMVTDEELEQRAEEDAKRIKIPKDRIINYYKSSEQIMDRFAGEKLMKTLLSYAKIKEVEQK